MLNRRQKYLQIAFNRTLEEVAVMINSLPLSKRIIIEAGYPLIKTYGTYAISAINNFWEQRVLTPNNYKFKKSFWARGIKSWPSLFEALLKTEELEESESISPKEERFRKIEKKKSEIEKTPFIPYIIADLKCMDRAFTEVEAAASAGASAATCLGLAPLETVNEFIRKCEEIGIDSILDMMNIEYPFEILSKLIQPPKIVMLHRGVDEGEENKEKEVPYHEIERIKSVYDDVLIAVAGGETINEVITGAFNDADIIVVWRLFNENPERVTTITDEFLKEVK